MKTTMTGLVVAAIVAGTVAPAASAAADGASRAGGRWVVSGKVGPFGFTLNCRFEDAGAALTGACVDGATSDARVKGGKRHELTRGKVVGDHVTFSYRSSFMLKHFDVDYAGVVHGDRMSGTILANGQSGAFTAARAGG